MAAHGRGRRKGGHDEGHESSERWLITYGDMLTLLMVLFIVLFAIGQVDQRKYAALKEGLSVGFRSDAASGAKPRPAKTVLDVGPQGVAAPGVQKPTPPDADKKSADASAATAAALAGAVSGAEQERMDVLMADATVEAEKFAELQAQITAALAKKGLQGSVQFRITDRGLVITIITDRVIFGGDSSALRPAGARILDAIAPPLRTGTNQLSVEGHTNHLGPAMARWGGSWELSAARAVTVVRYFNEHSHIPAGLLQATGFGRQRPLYPVKDPRAITLNRRVEVVVLSTLPPESRALLPTAAAAHP